MYSMLIMRTAHIDSSGIGIFSIKADSFAWQSSSVALIVVLSLFQVECRSTDLSGIRRSSMSVFGVIHEFLFPSCIICKLKE